MRYKTIYEIVNDSLKKIAQDFNTLEGVTTIDFLDIFPRSEEHKRLLDEEALILGKIIDKTERGDFYVLNTPIKTAFGDLLIIKIRKFDETRLPWLSAPDFNVDNYDEFVKKYQTDNRFTYIEKPTYKGLEFKTKNSLVYFLDEPTTIYYGLKKK